MGVGALPLLRGQTQLSRSELQGPPPVLSHPTAPENSTLINFTKVYLNATNNPRDQTLN